ncbi:MAG: hypothetical protein E7536_10925 [Ruminococcaceae bacterium]|nr:hypothetical protein [Oscillospiraceae bacterium]
MENLNRIIQILSDGTTEENYKIPYCWNYVGAEFEKADIQGEILVNSADYFKKTIEYIQSYKKTKQTQVLSFYSLFIRCFSAWDHGKGFENGTLLKTIALLPLIKEMGFNGIYILPVFEMSDRNKKGELPSPYAIKNIMKIESSLCDKHLPDMTAEEQFSALVEACHKLQMKVVLDFAFRTASRDSDLCKTHPDWFYWVKNQSLLDFRPPESDELGHTVVTQKNVKVLYKSDTIADYANRFAFAPDGEAVRMFEDSDRDFFEKCSNALGITVMPGFADTINDPQPAWSDVTFLKYYFDNTENVNAKFGENIPPMIAQDGIKCSLFPGKNPNKELWNYVKGVIPYYMDKFSIDGARIDMAHALPQELTSQIIDEIRLKDKKFLLWSEEFDTSFSEDLENAGYNFYTGGIWDMWDEASYINVNFNKRLCEAVTGRIPSISCTEMADTPRVMHNLGLLKSMASTVVTALVPNTIYFFNNGQEFAEKQPMNLGLRNTEKGRFVLPKNHPFYGKLAFFDKYQFDWKNRKHMYSAVKNAMQMRIRYSEVLSDINNYDLKQLKSNSEITVICGWNKKKGYLLLFNRGTEEIRMYAQKCVPKDAKLGECIYGCENKDVLYPNSVIVYDLESKK